MHKPNERSGGDLRWYDANEELESVMRDAELEDLRYSWKFFYLTGTIMKKLDCAVINAKWLIDYAHSEARILSLVTSDIVV